MKTPTLDKPKHSATFYLKDVNNNPGKYGISKSYIQKVNKWVSKAEIELEKNLKMYEPIIPGTIVKIEGKMAKVVNNGGDNVKIETTIGTQLTVDLYKVKLCRNQDTAMVKFAKECKKNSKSRESIDISKW